LRILVGLFALWYIVPEQDDLTKVAQTDPKLYAPIGIIFHAPISLELFNWLYRATIAGALCFTLGLWHRITSPLFALLLLWLLCYRNSWSMIYHSDNLLVLHVLILGFTRAADVYSLDNFLRGLRSPARAIPLDAGWQYGWPIRLMNTVTVIVYFACAVAKLCGPLGLSWVTGENLRAQMAVDGLRKELLGVDPNPVAYALYDWKILFTLLAALSFALELFAPLALLNKRGGRFWAINALLMHWGILFVMGITFRYQLSGIVFAPFFRVERAFDRLRQLGSGFFRRREEESMAKPAVPAPAASTLPSAPHATLYYDGDCGLCDRFVQFVLRHDGREYFRFAPLQTEAGQEHLARLGLSGSDLKTVVLVEADQSYVRSTATLRVCRQLAGAWPLLYALIIVPKPLRDGIYSLIMRTRKRWFKPPAACPVLPPKWRHRFIS
jgi:predicted DCC family thiol-disulfide oxidoreductase YuxK